MDRAHDAPVLHGDDSLAAPREFGVVRNKNECGARPSMQRENEIHDLRARFTIEIPGRFVREQDFRLRGKRAGKRDALLLAA